MYGVGAGGHDCGTRRQEGSRRVGGTAFLGSPTLRSFRSGVWLVADGSVGEVGKTTPGADRVPGPGLVERGGWRGTVIWVGRKSSSFPGDALLGLAPAATPQTATAAARSPQRRNGAQADRRSGWPAWGRPMTPDAFKRSCAVWCARRSSSSTRWATSPSSPRRPSCSSSSSAPAVATPPPPAVGR